MIRSSKPEIMSEQGAMVDIPIEWLLGLGGGTTGVLGLALWMLDANHKRALQDAKYHAESLQEINRTLIGLVDRTSTTLTNVATAMQELRSELRDMRRQMHDGNNTRTRDWE